MLRNIEVIKLVPHELNPRLNLGDLTELEASIHENGILQNLTAVETETHDVYKIIIGHRRLQAAINIGLSEVPCKVVEMNEKDQMTTMLLENMQRVDLTPYEQAQGIQQCLDFGLTEKEISKNTGFSRKKIRSRIKVLELDQEKVKKACNVSFDEFIKLEEIEDVSVRNKLINHIGTNNFDLEVEKAKAKQDLPIEIKDDKKTPNEVEPEIIKISLNLRRNFMSDIFKTKVSPHFVGAAAGVLNSMLFDLTPYAHVKRFDHFHIITNPNNAPEAVALEAMGKNKSNYLVVSAYAVLEELEDKTMVYEYITYLGYEISDEEKEFYNVEN